MEFILGVFDWIFCGNDTAVQEKPISAGPPIGGWGPQQHVGFGPVCCCDNCTKAQGPCLYDEGEDS